MRRNIGNSYEVLERSMRYSVLLSWMQSSEYYMRGEEDIRMVGFWPADTEEQTIELIESGFTPETASVLRECLRTILSEYLIRYVERLQISIHCSACVCIADPYGVLEPNEVHLSFSTWIGISIIASSCGHHRRALLAYLPGDFLRCGLDES
jgi:RNA dependent RNA polymerase